MMEHDVSEWPDHYNLPRQEERIYERDWDVLIVYDGCRWDAMNHILRDEDVEVEQLWTPTDSGTTQWTDIVWRGDWSDVTYISGNPQSENVRNYEDLGIKLEEHVGKFVRTFNGRMYEDGSAWDFSLGTSRPEAITDIALEEEPPMVVHYLQPHVPFVGKISLTAPPGSYEATQVDFDEDEINIFNLVDDGHVSLELYRAAYYENLVYAWQNSSRLRNGFDNVVVTADHGSALGPDSWGHGGSSDPRGQVVPWAEL